MSKKKLVAKRNQIWRDNPLVEGDSFEDLKNPPDDKERKRLIRIGLAIEVNTSKKKK